MGIDGRIYPVSATPKRREGELEHAGREKSGTPLAAEIIPPPPLRGYSPFAGGELFRIQVKQKDKVGRPDIN